jgi:hypothetical protein
MQDFTKKYLMDIEYTILGSNFQIRNNFKVDCKHSLKTLGYVTCRTKYNTLSLNQTNQSL